MRTSLAVIALLLAGCATTPEFTMLAGPRWVEGERDLGVTMLLIQKFGEHGVGGCAHSSLPSRGVPFNDKPEITFDLCGPGFRVGGK